MSSIKPILKVDKTKANGEAPLYIRVTKDRKSSYKSLSIYLAPKDWDGKQLRVKKSHPNSTRVNNLIAKRIAEINNSFLQLEERAASYRPNKVFDMLTPKPATGIVEFSKKSILRMERVNAIGTVNRFKAVVSKMATFLNGKDLPMQDISTSWLKDYETYLRKDLGNGTNTVASNMSVIRKIMNEAASEDLIEHGKNPFDKFKIKKEPSEIEYLTETELESFMNVTLTEGTRIEQHRDLYVFACYAGGIRIGDLLKLQWKNFDGERLTIVTSKTSEPLSIKLGEVALHIIDKQSGGDNKDSFIFGLLPTGLDLTNEKSVHQSISRSTAYVNKNLKLIAKKAGINKNIHFHTSRHTWATRALRKGMRIEHVSKLLTHRSIKTTQVYAKIVNADLDDAMDLFND